MRIVLGLGNPGERYAGTRHNLGFEVVDALARRRSLAADRLECNSLVAAGAASGGAGGEILLAKPLTYMNRSGHAAHCLVERHGAAVGEILVVYDEISLPLGRIRLRPSGGPGGHRGMESVISALADDRVARLRLGIGGEGADGEPGPSGEELVGFVLDRFAADERPTVEEMIDRAADACDAWIADGVEAAMNRFNAG